MPLQLPPLQLLQQVSLSCCLCRVKVFQLLPAMPMQGAESPTSRPTIPLSAPNADNAACAASAAVAAAGGSAAAAAAAAGAIISVLVSERNSDCTFGLTTCLVYINESLSSCTCKTDQVSLTEDLCGSVAASTGALIAASAASAAAAATGTSAAAAASATATAVSASVSATAAGAAAVGASAAASAASSAASGAAAAASASSSGNVGVC